MKRSKSGPKIGRNDPCWCGSGKKYKKCHLHRENEERIQPWQIDKEFKRVLEKRQCLAPDAWRKNCSFQISKAHTVPRSGSLARIARDGHVYSFPVKIQEKVKSGGTTKPQLMGINKASTFTGFCSEHDRSIFAPLETAPFTATPEQCFLLSYRAFARELFTKRAMASTMEFYRLMDSGLTVDDQEFVQTIAGALDEAHSLSDRDGKARKQVYDEILLAGSYHRVRAYVIEVKEAPPIMCSGGFCPEWDFEGHEMQDLADFDRVPHLLTVTSFYGGHYGTIALCWLDEDDATCVHYVESLHRIGDEAVTDALISLLFTHFENIHLQPQWWEALPAGYRELIVKRRYEYAHPLTPLDAGFLMDDGLRFDPWSVVARRFIGFEL
jgi:hypothetical protein